MKPQRIAFLIVVLGLQAAWAGAALQQTLQILPQRAGLEPVQLPPLDDLEEVVREQIQSSQSALQQLGSDEEVSEEGLAQAYGDIGRLYHAYEFAQAAESAYRNAYRLNPSSPQWPHLMGLLLEGQGRLQEAQLYFHEALRISPELQAARIHLGQIELQQNRPRQAVEFFRKVLESDPGDAAAHFGMGQAETALENWSAARDHFKTALERVPQAGRIHYALGIALRELGQLEEARSHLAQRNSVGVAPADPIADSVTELKRGFVIYTIRGRSQFQNGLIAQAAESFAKAVEAAPEDPGARVNLATALSGLDRNEEALQELGKALELEPDHPSAHFNLGVLMYKENPHEALRHFFKTLEQRPDDEQALQWAARLAVREEGQEEAARQLSVLAARRNRADELVVLEAVKALIEAGRDSDAAALLQTSEEEYPGRGGILHAWAYLLATSANPELRDGERAAEIAQAVYSARRSVAHGRTVALALAESGKCQEAADWASRMLRVAETSQQQAWVQQLQTDLQLYQTGPPCRPPFPSQEPDREDSQPPQNP